MFGKMFLYTSGTKRIREIFYRQYIDNRKSYCYSRYNISGKQFLQKTAHEKIFIGKPLEFDREEFLKQLQELKKEAYQDGEHIRESVRAIVSTYRYQ